jgi:plastocyanin
MAEDHGCHHVDPLDVTDYTDDMPQAGSPATRARVSLSQMPGIRQEWGSERTIGELRRFERKFINDKVVMPDGREIEFWGFEDQSGRRGLPSPTIRVNEGDIVQVTLKPSKQAHTIHHHGIEPDARNDGVGHTSFEVTGEYTYQWYAAHAGSYFYHCHVNTVLHVQMGMFGSLIIDPPTGFGKAFKDEDSPEGLGDTSYAVEYSITPFELDPRWHELSHAAGLDGENVGLHDFDPKYFLVNVAKGPSGPAANRAARPMHGDSVTIPRPGLSAGEIRVPAGRRVLIRLLNGGYYPVQLELDRRFVRDGGHWIASDAERFAESIPSQGVASKDTFRTLPFGYNVFGPLLDDPGDRYDAHLASVAERDAFLFTAPKEKGPYEARVRFFNWIGGAPEGTVDIPLVVE